MLALFIEKEFTNSIVFLNNLVLLNSARVLSRILVRFFHRIFTFFVCLLSQLINYTVIIISR